MLTSILFLFREEFIDAFLSQRNITLDLVEELMRDIIDNYRQYLDVMDKLREAMEDEPRNFNNEMGIRYDAKLKVHIVDAQNLVSGTSYYIRVE